MKIYTVPMYGYALFDIEVEANNEREAINKALEKMNEVNSGEVDMYWEINDEQEIYYE